ncbi:hypothetical protein THL1_3364 [Pseudomonas sp. TCU-HL1]|nr:hypothetical protein THL1_3364 [Pseudomonas sp. TCU-HL1]
MVVSMMIAMSTSETQFGPSTKTLMFHALSTWVLVRGARYQVLEEEFFSFALAPHDEALRRVYGVGAQEVAQGIQDLANAIRMGHAQAIQAISKTMDEAYGFVDSIGKSLEDGMAQWGAECAESASAASAAIEDLFQGGICNVRRHTRLPDLLLEDLSFGPGEETEFFAPGTYSGTPFRTLPARKKPLIKLDDDYYLTDPSFARDAAYRAILYNLQVRDSRYLDEFKQIQKEWSETAFSNIFKNQLAGATILREVYYRRDGNWFENDTVIMMDGVLAVVEAKSGAAATIASPAVSFDRHARAVRDLIVKAFEQCRRFIEYLASAHEVPLFTLKDGRYEEVARVRLSDYWLVLPVGLTVESYSPFSTCSKQLPGVAPILGKHPFISVSIDELLVLGRFLPNTGALMHYLHNRQEAAGIQELFLFDEFDHLGAYIIRNRFCEFVRKQLAEGAGLIAADGMSSVVDDYFSLHDWAEKAPPAQELPEEMQRLLSALARTRAGGWVEADCQLRDFSFEARNDLAGQLEPLRKSLGKFSRRYFALRVEDAILFWLHRNVDDPDMLAAQMKAQAVAQSVDVKRVLLLVIGVDQRGQYVNAFAHWIQREAVVSEAVRSDAAALSRRAVDPATSMTTAQVRSSRTPGRNDPCWCGSGTKFKRCHGR